MTEEKKTRKPKAKWDSEKELALLEMIVESNPFTFAHGSKDKAWDDISDRLKVPGGTDGKACKAKLVALTKIYTDTLKTH